MFTRWHALSVLGGAVIATAVLAASPNIAQVPEAVRNSPAYWRYARFLVEIDLLAQTATAGLPIDVSVDELGTMRLTGVVTDGTMRARIVENARRISGLTVQEHLRVGPVDADLPIDVPAEDLKGGTTETLAALFPGSADAIRVEVDRESRVVLTGSAHSLEEKALISRALKSQPGCRAVVNLLFVAPHSETAEILVSEDGGCRLAASAVPTIPAAPLPPLPERLPASTASTPSADDAPQGDLLDRQIREDVERQLALDAELTHRDLVVEVRFGVVYLTGDLPGRAEVELAVDAASQISEVEKIVARCRPVSIQRRLPFRTRTEPTKDPAEEPAGRRWFRWLSFVSNSEGSESVGWRQRRCIERALAGRCEGRLKNLAVRETLNGLVIEAEVDNARDRTFVFKQADNLVELRGVSHDLVLRLTEF